MVFLYLSISALILFLVYTITCLCLFGVTTSLSETYYEWEKIHKDLGKFLFYSVLVTVGLLTIISTVDKIGIFALLMVAGISMVAVFPEFLDKTRMDIVLHPLGAAIAAISAIISIYLLLPLKIALLLFGLVTCVVLFFALTTNTLKRCYVYHIEMIAFYSLFGGSVLYNLLFR